MQQLDFPTVCKYVGQLYLESRHELEQLALREADLKARLAQLEKERDDALKLLRNQPKE